MLGTRLIGGGLAWSWHYVVDGTKVSGWCRGMGEPTRPVTWTEEYRALSRRWPCLGKAGSTDKRKVTRTKIGKRMVYISRRSHGWRCRHFSFEANRRDSRRCTNPDKVSLTVGRVWLRGNGKKETGRGRQRDMDCKSGMGNGVEILRSDCVWPTMESQLCNQCCSLRFDQHVPAYR